MMKMLPSVLLVLLLITPARAALPEAIPARITQAGMQESLYLRDQPLRLRTACGTVHLPLREVYAISRSPADGRVRIETTRGDIWRVELRTLSGAIQILDGAEYRRLETDPPAFERIDVSPHSAEPTAPGMVRVRIRDEQQVVVTPENWSFDIPDGPTRWSLPMGAVQSLFRKERHMSNDWTVVFPSGVKADLPEPPRNRLLKATDRLGNALSIPLPEILRLDTISAAAPLATRPPGPIPTSTEDDHVPADAMPFTVLRVTGPLGAVPLPAAMLNAVSPLIGGGIQATTVYGEQYFGTVSPEILTLPNLPGRGTVTVSLNRDNLTWQPQRHLAPPAGNLLWQLRDGNLVAARFTDDTLALAASDAEPPVDIPTRTIVAVVNHGSRLTVRDDANALHYGRPTAARIALTLQISGIRHEIPWSQIDGIDRDAPPPNARLNAESGPRDGMRLIPGGTFLMGRTRGEGLPEELPPHALTVPAFYIDPCEITRAQFAEFVAATRYRTDAELTGQPSNWREPGFLQRPDEPVVWVSWHDAAQFCNWRSTAAGLDPAYSFSRRDQEVASLPDSLGYRLPTEVEWEYAARGGGADQLYPWGDDASPSNLITRANFSPPTGYGEDQWLWTNPVLSFPPNDLGLYGLAGNVWEWCEDWYFDRAYASVHRQRPDDPCVRTGDVAGLNRRVMRGGSFDSELELLRCAARAHGLPRASANRVGFRCVRSAPPIPPTGAVQP